MGGRISLSNYLRGGEGEIDAHLEVIGRQNKTTKQASEKLYNLERQKSVMENRERIREGGGEKKIKKIIVKVNV